jgi:sugar O-acyltransferase (sialic acid O-acetyltransferase NeuD family)
MSNLDFALIGSGGCAKEILAHMNQDLPCFVDQEYMTKDTFLLDDFNPQKYKALVAIADPIIRRNIVNRLPLETTYFSYIHPSTIVLDDKIKVAAGSFVGANCVLTTNINLGKHLLLLRGNHISHDCKIGDFFTALPNSSVSGGVHIGNSVLLGAGTQIRENIHILSNITVGMGSIVVNDLIDKGIYFGSPAYFRSDD